jgi:hypothetical protein
MGTCDNLACAGAAADALCAQSVDHPNWDAAMSGAAWATAYELQRRNVCGHTAVEATAIARPVASLPVVAATPPRRERAPDACTPDRAVVLSAAEGPSIAPPIFVH